MREEGYYWVKSYNGWGILFWDAKNEDWLLGGISCGGDNEFLEIDNRRIEREINIKGDFVITGKDLIAIIEGKKP